jgi:hypothetical protein
MTLGLPKSRATSDDLALDRCRRVGRGDAAATSLVTGPCRSWSSRSERLDVSNGILDANGTAA